MSGHTPVPQVNSPSPLSLAGWPISQVYEATIRIDSMEGFCLNQNNSQDNAQIIYFSHGGGPLPILGDTSHKAMVAFMRQFPSRLRRPGAILVNSAHWEEDNATLLGSQTPAMFYDYYGFPMKPMK